VRAAHHKRSMEEEARNILREAVSAGAVMRRDLAEAIRRRFEPFGGCDIESPARTVMRAAPWARFSRPATWRVFRIATSKWSTPGTPD